MEDFVEAVKAAIQAKTDEKVSFAMEQHWSQDLPVLNTTFGTGKGAVMVPCGFNGREVEADADRYAANIIKAWKAAK